jgi:hypothetical protein
MRIEGSEFRNITIDGMTYEHNVIIRLSFSARLPIRHTDKGTPRCFVDLEVARTPP